MRSENDLIPSVGFQYHVYLPYKLLFTRYFTRDPETDGHYLYSNNSYFAIFGALRIILAYLGKELRIRV